MCLREVRDTAQAGSLALLPTTPRGGGGVGWEGLLLLVPGQSALSGEGVRKWVVGVLHFNNLSLAFKDQGHISLSL